MEQKIIEMQDHQLIHIIQNSNDMNLIRNVERELERRTFERCEEDFNKAEVVIQ